MQVKHRFQNLCITVFGLTVSWAVLAHDHFGPRLQLIFGKYYSYLFILASLVSYDLILELSICAINGLDFLKKFYWGDLYLEGLWAYTSRSSSGQYFGIWKITQTVFETRVVAFGLDDDFHRRSTVQSVSDLMGRDGIYEIINERWDLEVGLRKQFSRTVIVPDQAVRHGLFFRYPDVWRGETIIYGGTEDGLVAADLRMRRRDDCKTEDELIQKLKQERGLPPGHSGSSSSTQSAPVSRSTHHP